MSNSFQIWLRAQGYTRVNGISGSWLKNGEHVSGKELHDKLMEFKNLNK